MTLGLSRVIPYGGVSSKIGGVFNKNGGVYNVYLELLRKTLQKIRGDNPYFALNFGDGSGCSPLLSLPDSSIIVELPRGLYRGIRIVKRSVRLVKGK